MVLQWRSKETNPIKVSKRKLVDYVTFVISTIPSIILFVVGFVLGKRQSKEDTVDVGDHVSEQILGALQMNSETDIRNVRYNRKTRNFEINNPDSTTSSD